MTKEIAISIAARLCRDGMTKSSIIAAFKRSFANATPFPGELYASESIDETLIAHWLRQRTRWLKGWMQTWLFEMRHPARFLEDLGTRRFLVYNALTAGLIVSTLLYPLMPVFIAYSVFSLIVADTTVIDCSILLIDCMNITIGYLSFHAPGKRSAVGKKIAGPILRCVPLYWLMMSAAAWRAVKQLCTKPFLWEKTPHRPSARESPGLHR